MRAIIAGMSLTVLVLVVGCNVVSPHRREGGVRTTTDDQLPTADKLVTYLNDNARRLGAGDALQCTNLSIDCKANGQAVGLGGSMICQKPRNFRLQAKVLSQPAVDIGSNDKEFWYWISKNEPPYLFHCSYDALARGTQIPFPFQPDMVVSALGLAEHDPSKKYELKAAKNYIELIEPSTSPQGQPIQKVTVFNRTEALPPAPQVIAHVLKDAKGEIICQAIVRRVQLDRTTNTAWPQEITFTWPSQRIEMKLQMNNLQVVKVDAQRAERVFTRNSLSYQTYDLASRSLDGAGVQRAGATAPQR
jgi:hypothetical protein